MPDSRETIIRIDHDEKKVYVWTANRGWLSKLRRVGAQVNEQVGRAGFYILLPRQVSLRKVAKSRRFSGKVGASTPFSKGEGD
jgi:hypothetical protein